MDSFKIEITDKGIFKVTTDEVSPANHELAEGLILRMSELAGGKTERILRPEAMNHQHHHDEQHDGSGGHSHGGHWHSH